MGLGGYDPWGGQGMAPQTQQLLGSIERNGPAIAKGIHGGMQAPDVIKKYIQHIINGEMDPRQAATHARLEAMGALDSNGMPNMQHPLFGATYGGVPQGAPQPMPAPQPAPEPQAQAAFGYHGRGGLAPQEPTTNADQAPQIVPSANAAAPGQGLYGAPVGGSYREGPAAAASGLSAGASPMGKIDTSNMTNDEVEQMLQLLPMIKALKVSDSPEDKLLRTMLAIQGRDVNNQRTTQATTGAAGIRAEGQMGAADITATGRSRDTDVTVGSREKMQDKELKYKYSKLSEDWNKALLAAKTRLTAVDKSTQSNQLVQEYKAAITKFQVFVGNASKLRSSITDIADPTVRKRAEALEAAGQAWLNHMQELERKLPSATGAPDTTQSSGSSSTTPGKASLLNAFGLE